MPKKLLLMILTFILISYLLPADPTINIIRPQEGTTICSDGVITVTWTKTGQQDEKVKIRIFDRTGITRIARIIDDVPNSGRYSFQVPGNVPGGSYIVRVKTMDNQVFDDSDIFNISYCYDATPEDNDPPSGNDRENLEITSPFDGERWAKGSSHRVRWKNAGPGNVKIELIKGGVSSEIYLGSNGGNWRWVIRNPEGTYKMKITNQSNTANTDEVTIHIGSRNLFYDFVVDSISKNNNGKLTARVKNRGTARYQGPLRFRVWINEQAMADYVQGNVDIGPNELSREIVSHTIENSSCGTHVQMIVNPPVEGRRLIEELNYNNNSKLTELFFKKYSVKLLTYFKVGQGARQKTITAREGTGLKVTITPEMVKSIKKIRSGVARNLLLKFKIPLLFHFRNCGSESLVKNVWLHIMNFGFNVEHKKLFETKRNVTSESGKIFPFPVDLNTVIDRKARENCVEVKGMIINMPGERAKKIHICFSFKGFGRYFEE